MTECPICETDGYAASTSCEECGHYDEHYIKLKMQGKPTNPHHAEYRR